MAKQRKTLLDLIRDKIGFIEASEKEFLEGIESMEIALFAALRKMLLSFDMNDGVISATKRNEGLILGLKKKVLDIIESSTLTKKLSRFLKKFDAIDTLNEVIYGRILEDAKVKLALSVEQKIFVDELTDALTNRSVLTAQFANPIRRMLLNAVAFGQSFDEAEANLRMFVKGDNKKLGRFRAYTGQVVTDALNGYDGMTQDKMRDEYSLDIFFYVGSLIRDSRSTCVELVNGTGEFADLALRPGVYPVRALPEVIRRASNNKGWNPATTAATFGQYRGGYNCRHEIVYARANEKERELIKNRYE